MLVQSSPDTWNLALWLPMLLAVVVPMLAGLIYALTGPALERKRRLQVIETALQRKDLEPHERHALIQTMVEPPRTRWAPVFVLGWLAMCGGGGYLLTGPDDDGFVAGVVVTALGFAFVTLPYAFREMERRPAQAS